MKNRVKYITINIILLILMIVTTNEVIGQENYERIYSFLNTVQVEINGEDIESDIILYNDITFISLKLVEELEMSILWDDGCERMKFERRKEKSMIDFIYKPTKELMQWVEKNKKNEGIYKREEQDKTIYMIAAGEKPNMGYAVSVNKTYKDNKGNVVIEYEMKQPGLGERVMQAFSYPYVLFFMDNQETAIFKEQKSIKE